MDLEYRVNQKGFGGIKASVRNLGLALGLFLSVLAKATPTCLDPSGKEVPLNNQKVLGWKESTANQFLARARISGVVQDIYPDRNGHYHFQAKIGPNAKDTIELIYNISFGEIRRIVPGLNVEACGDYITSNAPTQNYQPSPDGAIVHWIHRSPNPNRHPSGFLILNGTLYGQGAGKSELNEMSVPVLAPL